MKGERDAVGILASDSWILAVDKPPGICVIPEAYQPGAPCLAGLLEAEWGRLWVVHRIDRETSGILLFARGAEAHRAVSEQFTAHSVRKAYHLIVRGSPVWEDMVVDSPLRLDGDRRHRTVVDPAQGKPALTRFRVLRRFREHALLEACPRTGRTHQIRVHAAYTGHPVVADALYGDGSPLLLSAVKRGYRVGADGERPLMERTALHAWSLELLHPGTGEPLSLGCAYRRDMAAALAQLERWSRR